MDSLYTWLGKADRYSCHDYWGLSYWGILCMMR